jgi:hypothetical protein
VLVRTGASRLLAIEGVRHAIASRRRDRPSSKDARFALYVMSGVAGARSMRHFSATRRRTRLRWEPQELHDC